MNETNADLRAGEYEVDFAFRIYVVGANQGLLCYHRIYDTFATGSWMILSKLRLSPESREPCSI